MSSVVDCVVNFEKCVTEFAATEHGQELLNHPFRAVTEGFGMLVTEPFFYIMVACYLSLMVGTLLSSYITIYQGDSE